jgi:hypothetical protein
MSSAKVWIVAPRPHMSTAGDVGLLRSERCGPYSYVPVHSFNVCPSDAGYMDKRAKSVILKMGSHVRYQGRCRVV